MIRPTSRRQRGQAMTETLLAAVAVVPFLMVLPHIGKLLDMKVKTHESARYEAFEHSVHLQGKAGLSQETVARIQSEPGTRIQTGNRQRTDNRLWNGREGQQMVNSDDVQMAHARGAMDSGRGALLSSLISSGRLDVNENGMIRAESTITTQHLPSLGYRGLSVQAGQTGSAGEPLTMSSQLALLTDTWMPASEDEFAGRIEGLTLNRLLGAGVFFGCNLYRFLPILPDGRDCNKTDLKSESHVVLNRYLDRNNPRTRGQ